MNFDEELVELVRLFPCLWQTTYKGYKDNRLRESAWKEVAEKVRCYCSAGSASKVATV